MISLHHILPTLIFPLQLIQHESDEIHTTSSLRQVRSGHLQSERIIDGINFVGLIHLALVRFSSYSWSIFVDKFTNETLTQPTRSSLLAHEILRTIPKILSQIMISRLFALLYMWTILLTSCASPLPAGMEGIRASQYYRRAHDTIVVDLTVAIVDRGTDVEHWGLVLGAGALNSVRAG
ncbi:hypothetical protein LENED_008971 [Lentinula edodes]|uniref:Uncharacterized protein n=1 Tax=Lentinula edodes TaxID=5353 RepID=A0A1Q3EIL7_LENED|nr:hypothetical protein LENED_008971 [Lentinula edodes]